MCGIAGYKCFGNTRPSRQLIEDLMVAISERGRDATGVGYIFNGQLFVGKEPLEADKFIKSEQWKSHLGNILHKESPPHTVIFHARAKTKGSEKDNKNNHPVWSKNSGCAVVHNGIISNDDEIIADMKWSRDGEVDSEAILALMDHEDPAESLKAVQKASGSLAVAAISLKWPDKLVLLRHSSPLAYGYDMVDEILYFASTSDLLYEASQTESRGISCGPVVAISMEDNSAFIIGPESKEETKKLTFPLYSYRRKQIKGGWGDEGKDFERYCDDCRIYGKHEWSCQEQDFVCSRCKKKRTEDYHRPAPQEASSASCTVGAVVKRNFTQTLSVAHEEWRTIDKKTRRQVKEKCKELGIALHFARSVELG